MPTSQESQRRQIQYTSLNMHGLALDSMPVVSYWWHLCGALACTLYTGILFKNTHHCFSTCFRNPCSFLKYFLFTQLAVSSEWLRHYISTLFSRRATQWTDSFQVCIKTLGVLHLRGKYFHYNNPYDPALQGCVVLAVRLANSSYCMRTCFM